MSITIKELTVKNFMSVGNQTQAVNFTAENLTLVLGENLDQGGDDSGSRNGTGKTTIVNALSFALYGVALTNIKKDNLINKINNKNMLVTLTLSKDGTDYKIERGRKPAILNFINVSDPIKNQESDSQGESKDTQEDINDLLGMSHDMFKHILALNTYSEPFLSMRAGDQRAIIEQLLGITLLSEKADTLGKEIKKTKDLIFQEKANLEATQKANEKIQQSIDTLVMSQRAWNAKHKADLEKIAKSIVELESLNIEKEIQAHSDVKIYNEQYAKIKSLSKEKATLDSAITQAHKTLSKYVNDYETLQSKKCPACDQDLHDHKHDEMIATANTNVIESQKYYDKVVSELTLISDELSSIQNIGLQPETFYDTLEEALKHQNNLSTLTAQLNVKAVEVNPYDDQIIELKSEALQEINWDIINDLNKLKDHQDFLQKLLTNKDSFIRKKIIDQNLSYLNNRLTYYLDKMGLPHTVVFQNDLSVEITQLGQDLDFDNLSRGERNRLILGLSWAFRDVWESLYQGINLLFIDELVDNGLDASGVENALSVLKKISRERKKNVFLISHKDELIGRVNNVLKVVKENGFTSYATDLEIIE
jgi:DNA repair exonuclease SbcCD ATPase subunit